MSTVLKDPAHGRRLVYGIGINDADYLVYRKAGLFIDMNGNSQSLPAWECPFYKRWKSMLQRCGSAKEQMRRPTYSGCIAAPEWLIFSNFKAWMEKQDWKGKELDKDLLVPGNKVYGPETCCFIPAAINRFITESGATRGRLPIGVREYPRRSKYAAQCHTPEGRTKHLGHFDTPEAAHQAWLAFKLQRARELAANESDPRIARALIERYENYGKVA